MSRRHRRTQNVKEPQPERLEEKEESSPSNYFHDKHDTFYGAIVGAATAGLVSMALLGAWNAFIAFAVGYLVWFAILFFGLKIPAKPIRMRSKAFKFGVGIGLAGFALLVGALYLLLG